MKFFLISDNADTAVGLRLAGIEGVVCHEADEVLRHLQKATAQPDIAVVLLTGRLAEMCRAEVDEWKLHHRTPLITVIPDRHGDAAGRDAMLRYVREAIGIKV